MLLIPVICLYEVSKVVNRQRSETEALQAIAAMQQGRVVPLTSELALAAAARGQGDQWRERAGGDLFTDPGETRSLTINN
jgi:hypothetical protein